MMDYPHWFMHWTGYMQAEISYLGRYMQILYIHNQIVDFHISVKGRL